jgi:peptide/nickel transport system substrate-binding protein
MLGRLQCGRRAIALFSLIAITASTLASCASGLTDARTDVEAGPSSTLLPPEPGGRLVYGLESDPNGFDPTRNAWDNAGIQLANALFDPLVAVDAEGRFQPYLAESFASNQDHTAWFLNLRPNISFSDGDQLDADALVKFIEALRKSAITGPPAQLISGVQKVDELTVQVTTSRPWATMPALLSGQGGYVVAPAQLEDPEGHSKPIGTGPFTLSDWQQDRLISVIRNPRYWRTGLPYLNAVDFVVEPRGTRRIDQVRSGQMDVTAITAPWDLRSLEATMASGADAARLSVQHDEGDAEKTFVMFNTRHPPLNDVRIRQAIAYATDLGRLAAVPGGRADQRARGPFSPTSPFYTPVDYPGYDPDKARSLITEYLADTSVRGRRAIAFKFLAPDVGSDILHAMIEQWSRVGINVELTIVDVKNAVRLAVAGTYDAMMLRYFASPDPDVLWHFFVSDTVADDGISLNFTRLRNDDITSGMTEARATLDVETRRRAYAKVQKAFAEQMPYLWMERNEWRVVTSGLVRNARNVTLPDRSPALPLFAGTFRLTETWIDH